MSQKIDDRGYRRVINELIDCLEDWEAFCNTIVHFKNEFYNFSFQRLAALAKEDEQRHEADIHKLLITNPHQKYDFEGNGNGFTSNHYENAKRLNRRLVEYLEEPSELKSKPKPKKSITLEWPSTSPKEELLLVYDYLINPLQGCISEQTNFEQFMYNFSGQPISGATAIHWIESNKLLAYFLVSVFKGQDWQSITEAGKLFINFKGKPLNRNDLSQANSRKYGPPKRSEMIDRLLKEVKNIKNHKTS